MVLYREVISGGRKKMVLILEEKKEEEKKKKEKIKVQGDQMRQRKKIRRETERTWT